MNKAQLINKVADTTELTKADAAIAVESILENITEALTAGEVVSLVGFGAFSISERKARTARNPRTGEIIAVGPSRSPRFKAGKSLKEAIK
ncbi:MAG: HU family DNA-binding protein [Mariprofundales bacterium]